MSPAAIAVPRFTNNNASANSSGNTYRQRSKNSHLNTGHGESGDWDNMDGGLDFDLLAEYLLEDGGMGGFDFV